MLNQILSGTPRWVWVLLLVLIGLGLRQVRARRASLARITALPLVMASLSLAGMASAFGADPKLLLVWLATGGLMLVSLARRAPPEGARYDVQARRFTLPGSWVPLLLILGIFLVKYFVGVATAIQPAVAQDPLFAFAFSALYGVFCGIFLARAARLWRLALREMRSPKLGAAWGAMGSR